MREPNAYKIEGRAPFYAFEDGSMLAAATVHWQDSCAAAVERNRRRAPSEVDSAMRRWLDASRGRPVIFSDGDLKRWRLIRDESGAVWLDKGDRRAKVKRAAVTPAVAQQTAPAPDHLDVIRGLLDWIDGRTLDPSIVIRAAKLVGSPAKVHA